MKDRKLICFEFEGVLKEKGSDEAIPHAIPMLYRYLKDFDIAIFSWKSATKEGVLEMRNWVTHHDMEWRQCCNRILADPKEEDDDKETARMTLEQGPLVGRIRFPKNKPQGIAIYFDPSGFKFTGVWPDLKKMIGAIKWIQIKYENELKRQLKH